MLAAIASGFVLAIAAPFFRRAGWALPLLPVGLALYFGAAAPGIWEGTVLQTSYDWAPALGLFLSFRLDGLSLVFALLITGLGAIVLMYGGGYLHGHRHLGRFYAFLLSFMSSMLGLVLADNLLVLYVFWELTGISSYLLIGFDHHRDTARRAALQALLVTGAGGLSLLGGFLLLGRIAGSFEISALLNHAESIRAHALYLPALFLILAGAFTKSAQFPFHFWLPAAMEAPTPVSAYLHAATMVKAGVYLLARLTPVLGSTDAWSVTVTGIGGLTMLAGGILALTKTDLKQILAYSTVSVLGILTFLIGIGSPAALKAMVVYLIAHGLYKGALFLVAGALDHETGTRDITKLSGLWRAMPVTAGAALLAALSMAGLPPLFGFIGKELFYEASVNTPLFGYILTTMSVVAGVLLFALAGAVGFRPFFSMAPRKESRVHEAAASMWVGPAALAAGGLVLGLAPATLDAAVRSAVASMSPAVGPAVELGLFHGLSPALLLSMVSVAGGLVLYWLHGRALLSVPRLGGMLRWGPALIYERLLDGLSRVAAAQTRALQTGSLRHYLLMVIVTTIGLVGFAIARGPVVPSLIDGGGVHLHEAVLASGIIAGTIAAVRSTSRLTSVAALGVVGIGVALVFALFGAPDLAMTQLAVEALTVILLVLVLYHLPDFSSLTARRHRVRDLAVSLAGGALMMVLVLAAAGVRYAASISPFYLDNSYALAHGRNVVNVILTDFRSLDTLGEITVVATSAVGVWAILRYRAREDRPK